MPTKQFAHGILAYNNVSQHTKLCYKMFSSSENIIWTNDRNPIYDAHHTKLGYEMLNGSETKLSSGESPDTPTHKWFQHITTTTTTTTTLFWGV